MIVVVIVTLIAAMIITVTLDVTVAVIVTVVITIQTLVNRNCSHHCCVSLCNSCSRPQVSARECIASVFACTSYAQRECSIFEVLSLYQQVYGNQTGHPS